MKKLVTFFFVLVCLAGCTLHDWEKKANDNLKNNEEELLQVIEHVKNNKLEQKYNMLYNLPKELDYLSEDSIVEVYQNNEEGIQIGFFLFRGMQTGSCYLMFSSCGENMIRANETGHLIKIIKHIKDNWYYVETDY